MGSDTAAKALPYPTQGTDLAQSAANQTACPYLSSDLAHRVPVSQGGRVGRPVNGVEVDRDPEGHANLVGPGVAPADGPGGIIHLVRDAVPG